jgi:hypothetical protein
MSDPNADVGPTNGALSDSHMIRGQGHGSQRQNKKDARDNGSLHNVLLPKSQWMNASVVMAMSGRIYDKRRLRGKLV